MKRIILLVTVALLMVAFAGVAQAQPNPDEHAPIGESGSHTHFVQTGNGGCKDIDSVSFERESRGLHRGANESGTDHGPSHGSC